MKQLVEHVVSDPNIFTALIITLIGAALLAFVMLNSKYIPLFNNKYVGKLVQAMIFANCILFVASLGSSIHTCISNNATQEKFEKLPRPQLLIHGKIDGAIIKEITGKNSGSEALCHRCSCDIKNSLRLMPPL